MQRSQREDKEHPSHSDSPEIENETIVHYKNRPVRSQWPRHCRHYMTLGVQRVGRVGVGWSYKAPLLGVSWRSASLGEGSTNLESRDRGVIL